MDIDSEESYARLCTNCGHTFGQHNWAHDLCPIIDKYGEIVDWDYRSKFEEVKDGNAS